MNKINSLSPNHLSPFSGRVGTQANSFCHMTPLHQETSIHKPTHATFCKHGTFRPLLRPPSAILSNLKGVWHGANSKPSQLPEHFPCWALSPLC